jgi:hypothetical protein
MPFKVIPDEQLAAAKQMLDNGSSIADTSKATGISQPTLYKRFRHAKDPTPGGGGKHKQPKINKPPATDEQLLSWASKVAVAPAVPMALVFHCDYCAAHFANTGPDAAKKLIELSHGSPALRTVLESINGHMQEAMWAGILATWLGVPLLHHAAPDGLYRFAVMLLGMPARGVSYADPSMNGHSHASGAPAPESQPTPFAGMDVDQLLHMAESFGINVEMPDFVPPIPDAEVVTDAPTEPSETDIDAATDTVTATASETDVSDTDTE